MSRARAEEVYNDGSRPGDYRDDVEAVASGGCSSVFSFVGEVLSEASSHILETLDDMVAETCGVEPDGRTAADRREPDEAEGHAAGPVHDEGRRRFHDFFVRPLTSEQRQLVAAQMQYERDSSEAPRSDEDQQAYREQQAP